MKLKYKILRNTLYATLGLSFSSVLMAADCSINYGQDTTISADCDGFELERQLDFDITIDSGVT